VRSRPRCGSRPSRPSLGISCAVAGTAVRSESESHGRGSGKRGRVAARLFHSIEPPFHPHAMEARVVAPFATVCPMAIAIAPGPVDSIAGEAMPRLLTWPMCSSGAACSEHFTPPGQPAFCGRPASLRERCALLRLGDGEVPTRLLLMFSLQSTTCRTTSAPRSRADGRRAVRTSASSPGRLPAGV
jgi:hypothetical protein